MQLLNQLRNKTGLHRYPKGIWAAMGIQAIRVTGYSISYTYLALYLYQHRHISMTVIGAFILISGIISGAFQILGGVLADRFGHRKMFIIFQTADVLFFGLLAMLIGLNSEVWSIFIVSTLASIMGGMSAPAISAMVSDVSQQDHLTESYGLMAIGMNLGWAIGPLAGGFLKNNTSFAWVFAVGALVASLSLFGSPFLPRDVKTKATELLTRQYLKMFIKDTTLIVFCILCILFFLDIGQWGSTLSVFTVDRIGFSTEQYGLLMSISGVLIIIFQYPISSRVEWLGTGKALFLGCLFYGVGFLSLSWVKSFVPAIGSIAVMVAGEMLFVPTSYSVIGKLSRAEDRGKNMGLLGLCGTVGSSCGPLLGGFLLDQFPTQPLYVWGPIAFPAFIAAVGFLLWRGPSRTEVLKGKEKKT